MAEESASWLDSLRSVIREEVQVSVKNIIDQQPAFITKDLPGPSSSTPRETLSVSEEEGEKEDVSSASEEELSGRPLFLAEDTEGLLRMVRSSMDIEEKKPHKSVQDIMFEGLTERKRRTFPIHDTIRALISKEWQNPDKKSYIPRAIKRKYPFDESATSGWGLPPKVDASIIKISRGTSLPFEDINALRDPMDRKAESFLKKSWEYATTSFRPAVAATCVARSLLLWLDQLGGDIQNKVPRESLKASITGIQKGAALLADASVDILRLSARSTALSNAARRALWLKNWSGDMASRGKLCGIPCDGNFLFGPILDDLLEKAGDKKKGFPTISTQANRPRSFRSFRRSRYQRRDRESRPGPSRPTQPARGYLFGQQHLQSRQSTFRPQ
ncbi:hypothetical protein GDO81_021544 [Engystomops pustulosus]|uniref:PH domain-containing protein n=1 Tax=Engystomops pustulosus TaxID=76066 RepID=A0AAV6YVT3_ENGPU|nr:hypothetical protein GDO81_021544 [Engystomops pustulosus]